MKQKITLEKLATTIETLVEMVQKLPTKEFVKNSIEESELRITKATAKGFESMSEGTDALEKRVHGTELGINRIEMAHANKIRKLEDDMISFRTSLTKAKILTK